MKKTDYLIVGFGIAGACFAKECIENNKSFHVVADFQKSASFVAAGMFNPIVLKRFNPVDNAIEQMNELLKTFKEFEFLLNKKIIHPYPIYRIFANENEVTTWKKKIAENEILKKYLNPNVVHTKFKNIHAPHGYGEVYQTGWIDLVTVIQGMLHNYTENFTQENFDFKQFSPEHNSYKNIQAKKVVFAEGVKVLQNPYFQKIPIIPNKGETLIIQTDADLPDVIFKSKNFLMPLGNQRYYVGATYARTWKTQEVTQQAKDNLVQNLQHYFKDNFEILEHRCSFRPTTQDRKPIIGKHQTKNDLYILNGMGTRGTFNAPSMAKHLFRHIEKAQQIPEICDVRRLYK